MTTQWYLYKNGKQSGPLSWDQLVEQGRSGIIGPSDMVWAEGMGNWARAGQTAGLIPGRSIFSATKEYTKDTPFVPENEELEGQPFIKQSSCPSVLVCSFYDFSAAR